MLVEKIKQFILKLNNFGVPLPLLRDPKQSAPSVSLTMLFISFNVVLLGMIGKIAKVLDIDLTQAIYWFGICATLYFGRNMSGNGKSIELTEGDKK